MQEGCSNMALKSLYVPSEADGWRIDRFLNAYFPELSVLTVRSSFSRRDIKLDKKRVKQDQRIQTGQLVEVYYVSDTDIQEPLNIVYEDSNILLVNKSAGLSVEPDQGGGLSLTELCSRYLHRKSTEPVFVKACHRLDNKTCGLCLFAKNETAYQILLDVFKSRTLEKYYICLVRGYMKPAAATCKAWLKKNAEQAIVSIFDHPVPESREIITAYSAIENSEISRLKVHLITGRTHQIRAHLASLGHPILGDDVYGDRTFNRRQKIRQLKLCAVSLKLNTQGRIPELDDREFMIDPPF